MSKDDREATPEQGEAHGDEQGDDRGGEAEIFPSTPLARSSNSTSPRPRSSP